MTGDAASGVREGVHQERDLVAADARQGVARTQFRPQLRCDLGQDPIAAGVAVFTLAVPVSIARRSNA